MKNVKLFLKQNTKNIFISLLLLIMTLSVFVVPVHAMGDMPSIEYWKDGVAYTADNQLLSAGYAYDLWSEGDKYVLLDENSMEISRSATRVVEDKKPVSDEIRWVEFKANVPEGLNYNINVMLADENFNTYEFVLYPINDFIHREQIPCGTYTTHYCMVWNDVKNEYPLSYPDTITVDEGSRAATAYHIESLWDKDYEMIDTEKTQEEVIEDMQKENIIEEPIKEGLSLGQIIIFAVLGIFGVAGIVIYIMYKKTNEE